MEEIGVGLENSTSSMKRGSERVGGMGDVNGESVSRKFYGVGRRH